MFSIKLQEKIETRYEEMLKHFGQKKEEIQNKINALEVDTAIAMKYLYGTMPLSDVANYPFETFLDYAEHGVWLWKNGKFSGMIPEEIFLPYVLYHRVNTEDISKCRKFFYRLMEGRVSGNTMEEAVLSVNYWCASEATYRASDDRTASPMTVYRSCIGRCGEESAFAVTALRSMGIPARQVYAPRWSHCDDNHAWVEAWCQGEWKFLGACEPEEILNKGWFTNASSRAMLIHSKYNGFEPEGEEVIGSEGRITMLNQLERYAHTRRICVTVLSREEKPLQGVTVKFAILNYAQICVIAEAVTDKDGKVSFVTGIGNLIVQAFLENQMLEVIADAQGSAELVLKEGRDIFTEKIQEIEFLAPKDARIHTGQPDEFQKAEGRKKLEKAVAHRKQKASPYGEKEKFLSMDLGERAEKWKNPLLEILPEKDHRDLNAEILCSHVIHAMQFEDKYEQDIFLKYILNPRIDWEFLTDYRPAILARFSEKQIQKFSENPVLLWNWIKENIKEVPEKEDRELITCPGACLELGIGSTLSQKILFAASCRTMGIPARLNPVAKNPEYYLGDRFVPVEKNREADCMLTLLGKEEDGWKYEQNYTLARLEKGGFVTLSLQEQWEQEKFTVKLERGAYRIVTANRLPNGNLFSIFYDFILEEGTERTVELKLKEACLEEMLETLELPEFVISDMTGESIINSRDLLQGNCSLNIWVEESKEPTEHILNELRERCQEVNESKIPIHFFLRDPKAREDVTLKKTCTYLENYQFFLDNFNEHVEMLARRMYTDPEKLPLILVTDKAGRGVYATSGYNVGTADMLLRVFEVYKDKK